MECKTDSAVRPIDENKIITSHRQCDLMQLQVQQEHIRGLSLWTAYRICNWNLHGTALCRSPRTPICLSPWVPSDWRCQLVDHAPLLFHASLSSARTRENLHVIPSTTFASRGRVPWTFTVTLVWVPRRLQRPVHGVSQIIVVDEVVASYFAAKELRKSEDFLRRKVRRYPVPVLAQTAIIPISEH